MFEPDQDGVDTVLPVSQPRRYFACAVLYLLGGLLIYTALAQPPVPIGFVFLVACGTTMLWLAEKLRRATLLAIVLTRTELRDTAGTLLARLDDISHVDRGLLALKPANGFTLVLTKRRENGWAPGLWWRVGRRVGIGGVTAAAQSKVMADRIAQRIKDRNA